MNRRGFFASFVGMAAAMPKLVHDEYEGWILDLGMNRGGCWYRLPLDAFLKGEPCVISKNWVGGNGWVHRKAVLRLNADPETATRGIAR